MNPGYIQSHYKKTGVFTSSWKTDNLSTGSSANNQVKLPLVSTGTYKFYVDWGDGTSDFINTWNQTETTHTYSSTATYTVKIRGLIIGWSFNNTGDRLKILNITKWGCLRMGNTSSSSFHGCTNLVLTGVTDILNLKGTTSISGMFINCSSITTINNINSWNTSSITSLYSTFENCINFDDNIGNWDVSNVLDFHYAFRNSKFNNGGSPSINNWNIKVGADLEAVFYDATYFNQSVSSWKIERATRINST